MLLAIFTVTTYQQNENLVHLVVISAWRDIYFGEYDWLFQIKQCRTNVVWFLDTLYCEMFDLTQTYVALFS
jgi:hypothetical protein